MSFPPFSPPADPFRSMTSDGAGLCLLPATPRSSTLIFSPHFPCFPYPSTNTLQAALRQRSGTPFHTRRRNFATGNDGARDQVAALPPSSLDATTSMSDHFLILRSSF